MGRYVESCMFYGYLFDKDDGEEVTFDKIDADIACHSKALKVGFSGDESSIVYIAIESSIQECDDWVTET